VAEPTSSNQDRPPDQVQLARQALAAARARARAKGQRPAAAPQAGAAPAGADRAWPDSPAQRQDPDAGVPAPGPTAAGVRAAPPPDGARPDGARPAGDASAGGTLAGGPPGRQRPRRESQRRIRRDDPQPLGTAIGGLLDSEGWNLAAATGSVFGRWAQIVGPELAGHTQPESLRDGELTVQADSTAWATQLRLLAAQLVRRLNAELGAGTVLRVKVRGPVTTERRPGEWRVRGSRGPRDTYG
jgi:predicted nucleic acid-binding Zn ribbon protein